MGSLFTTATGTELSALASGDYFLDFLTGNITQPDGTVTQMNKNLNDLGLTQCNSIGVWCSDADATLFVGSAISLSDHKLSHVINNYGFSSVRINIPANSTPDNTNQLFFMAGTDGWLNYAYPEIAHQTDKISGISSNTNTVVLQKHVGAYNQILITTSNTHGSNSLDVQIEFSENGVDWFLDSGYTTAVTVASNSYNQFSTEIEHHFYRVLLASTSTGNHATFDIIYNFVKDRGV